MQTHHFWLGAGHHCLLQLLLFSLLPEFSNSARLCIEDAVTSSHVTASIHYSTCFTYESQQQKADVQTDAHQILGSGYFGFTVNRMIELLKFQQ